MPDGSPPSGMPPADVNVTADMVRVLLERQHPDLADLPVRFHGNGWDNTTFRLGTDLAVRLPRRTQAVELIQNEQAWLPAIARMIPIRVPAPVRVGVAGPGYPWPWSVVPWFPGRDAVADPLPIDAAPPLGRLLRRLHQPGPAGAPRNPFRGVPLAGRGNSVENKLARIDLGDISVTRGRIGDVWQRSISTDIDAPDGWIHGDLHPRNVVVVDGEMHALIDWGDMCVGDPATDLAAAWLLFDTDVHESLRLSYGTVTDATWERARGWAISFGVLLVDAGSGHDEAWANVGRRALERACA